MRTHAPTTTATRTRRRPVNRVARFTAPTPPPATVPLCDPSGDPVGIQVSPAAGQGQAWAIEFIDKQTGETAAVEMPFNWRDAIGRAVEFNQEAKAKEGDGNGGTGGSMVAMPRLVRWKFVE